jgi:hypothetical protein
MARKKDQTELQETVVTDKDTPGLKSLVVAVNHVAAADALIMDAAEVLKKTGRIEALQFVATVADRVIAETYSQIKESKAYKGIPYRDAEGNVATVATIQEFCEAFMPKSYRRCEQLSDNLHLLGPELYEQADAIGFRQRDYGALKALPADDQAIVKQAIEGGKLETAIDLMQEMVLKHAKEKETLTAENTELKADHEALGKVVEDKNKKLDQLDKQIKKSVTQPWDAQVPKLNEEINMVFDVIMECADKLLSIKDIVLNASFENDRDQTATKMLALNYFDRTQRMVEAVALVQQVAFEDFDCYINAPKRKLIAEETK